MILLSKFWDLLTVRFHSHAVNILFMIRVFIGEKSSIVNIMAKQKCLLNRRLTNTRSSSSRKLKAAAKRSVYIFSLPWLCALYLFQDIVSGKRLGDGSFGVVREGDWTTSDGTVRKVRCGTDVGLWRDHIRWHRQEGEEERSGEVDWTTSHSIIRKVRSGRVVGISIEPHQTASPGRWGGGGLCDVDWTTSDSIVRKVRGRAKLDHIRQHCQEGEEGHGRVTGPHETALYQLVQKHTVWWRKSS